MQTTCPPDRFRELRKMALAMQKCLILRENRTSEFSDSQAHALIVPTLDAQVVPGTKIPDVLREWREPRHPDFRQGKTSWRL
jgi:hypothetical protein